ncbi:hypothetical protein RB653_002238 [Dictyostelium firmibasis]|uniref:Uncharacterized protein n=1 Tax=Dictyostelium firmibasis TaxID=79012 RepID=A0AAN7YVH0_9MYCE
MGCFFFSFFFTYFFFFFFFLILLGLEFLITMFFFCCCCFLEVELFRLIMRCVIYDHVTSWYDLRLEPRPRRQGRTTTYSLR